MAMNYNPYAAPTADARMGGPALGGMGAPTPWTPTEVISQGWEAVKRDFPVLVFAPLLGSVIAQVPGGINRVLLTTGLAEDPTVLISLSVVFTFLGMIIGFFFQVGMLRIYLCAARGESPEFSLLFGGADRFLALLGSQLLFMLITFVGTLFFLVPGFIAMAGLFHAQFFVVDRNMGPIEALSASWEATKGQKGNVFVLGLLTVLLLVGGMFACCIGYIIALPVASVGAAIAYLHMTGQARTAMAGGFGPPPGAPPGGYAGGFGGPPGGFGGPPQGGGFGAPPGGGFGAPPGGFGGPPQGGGYPPPGGGWGG